MKRSFSQKYLECKLPSFQSHVSWKDSMSSLPDVQLTPLEEPLHCDKKRGEGGSCLCHGSDVLMCDPEANELLHYPLSAVAGLQQHMEIKACGCHEREERARIFNRCSCLRMWRWMHPRKNVVKKWSKTLFTETGLSAI